MSVLSFPRIYFKGYISWDPCTFNNNDWQAFPTYDGANAALNWDFLKTQNPPITPENFTTTFRPWAITLQNDNEDSPSGPRVPAEWNMFGSHAVSFAQYQDKTTTIIGGDLAYGQPVTNDPLIGTPISLQGDGGNGPGRLVDTNPASFWSSQVYFGALQAGAGNTSLAGPRRFRMHARWLNLGRIYGAAAALTQPAASVATCLQTCIPNDQLTWTNKPDANGATSQLLAKLQEAATKPGAQGVMIRFTAYVNLYFQNGIFNNTTQQPRNFTELATLLQAAWDAWNKNGDTSQFFSQPCYSHTVGVIGVWNDGELASAPGGRYLAAQDAVTPVGGTAATTLGPVVAQVDYDQRLISLDLNSAIPEAAIPNTSTSDLTKTNFGALTLGTEANGVFTPITKISYEQYQRSAYEARAGIIDIPFPAPGVADQLKNGLLAIQAPSHPQPKTSAVIRAATALAEPSNGYSAQTDQRGIYLDENGQQQFQISVYKNGAPAPGTQVLVAKYDNNLSLIPTGQTQFVNFTSDQQTIQVGSVQSAAAVVTADATGKATVGIAAQSPGFPVLAFYPFAAGAPWPQPPAALLGPPSVVSNAEMITNAFYTTVRVLPFDATVPQQFLDLWNSTHDPAQAWDFIYTRVLYVYDMLFSVMLEFVNLGDRASVEQAIHPILKLTSQAAAQESTMAMPITRDMSAGKRTALQLWAYLVLKNYQVPTLSLDALTPPPTTPDEPGE